MALAVGAILLAIVVTGCSDAKALSEGETKELLRELPYRFEFRPVDKPDGATGAVAGTAYGPYGTVVRFGVSLGLGGAPVSLGPHSDLANATGGETFRVTGDDMLVVNGKLKANPRLKTGAQWQESAKMLVDIEEKLCEATEGKPCAI